MSFKKTLVLLVTLSLLLMSLGAPVFASGTSTKLDPGLINVTPSMAYISRAATSLTISSYGLASVTGSITGYQGITDAVYIFLDLQMYSNGSWTTIASWSESYQSYRGYLTGSYYVPSGYSYRVVGTYYAHSDYTYEEITVNSRTAYY